MPEVQRSTIEELSRFFAPAYIREEVEKLRGWQHQLALDTSFGRVISTPTWISGVSIQNKTVDAEKLNVGELKAITAYTGSLVVSGAAANPAGGQLTVAADPNSLLVSSITFRAVADANNTAGMTFRNASGTKTVEMKLDGSGQIGAGTAITWDTNGVVTVPSGLITGGITITNVTTGRIGGTYDVHASNELPTSHPFIRIDPANGIGIFGPTANPNWANARVHLKKDGSAIFQHSVTIKSSDNSRLEMSTANGIRFLGPGDAVRFQLDTAGTLRIRSARIGDDGSGSGQRIEVTTSEIAGYTGDNQPTFRLGTDGTGYIKAGSSSTQAIAWNASGVTINADTITVNNLSVSKVTGGTFGGTYEPTSTNTLVWFKDANGVPLSYISPNQLWVETTSNQARFVNTIRSGSTITDACSLDLFQTVASGPPKQYYGYVRMRYGATFSDGPFVAFQHAPGSGYHAVRIGAGTTTLDVTDLDISSTKTINAPGALFTGNITVTTEIRCSVYRPYSTDTVLYIALPAGGQFQVRDHNNTVRGGWKADGTPILNGPNSGTAGTLQGYIHVEFGGHTRKIPYYSV